MTKPKVPIKAAKAAMLESDKEVDPRRLQRWEELGEDEAAATSPPRALDRVRRENVIEVLLPDPHAEQLRFIESQATRKVIRAGRRGGKTVGAAIMAVMAMMSGQRVLYATPTADQLGAFWDAVVEALLALIEQKVVKANLSSHTLRGKGGLGRIKAKTAWNADTMRGDFADVLILDEFQLMHPDTWDRVGAPMMLDTGGTAVFIYTPPSLASAKKSTGGDPRYAARLYAKAQADTTGKWAVFAFSSHSNPYLNTAALSEIAADMTPMAYRMEILAEDVTEVPGALWSRQTLEEGRITIPFDFRTCTQVVIGVDPSATSAGDEAGVLAVGRVGAEGQIYVLRDDSIQGSPTDWGQAAVDAFYSFEADYIVAESNNGGEMVAQVIAQIDPKVPVKLVWASRGKQARAQPVSVLYKKGLVHHVGSFYQLEDEMCLWTPGDPSPNRMDALVWAISSFIVAKEPSRSIQQAANPFYGGSHAAPQQLLS